MPEQNYTIDKRNKCTTSEKNGENRNKEQTNECMLLNKTTFVNLIQKE